jgi:nucleoside-diphosphate-sugar epimerase
MPRALGKSDEMRILLIGGSGYVARLMLPRLQTHHFVRVLDLRPPGGDIDVDFVTGNAADLGVLAAAMHGIDAVVHTTMGRHGADGQPDPASAFEATWPRCT